MARNIAVPDHIDARTEFKKKYGLGELYRASKMLPAAAGKISTNRRTKLVDKDLIERMQLAVTEVNGCSV
ncbi:MAG TPA: alkylhydroperoxidase, partial [Sphaerochaeta sp.]|nr:alkylhydroperoxidase [Sphaerochaeta sp.]